MKAGIHLAGSRTKAFGALAAILVFLATASLIYIGIERGFDPVYELTYTPNKSLKSDPIMIGVFGDSWVAGEKLDAILTAKLSEQGLRCKVLSSGHPGANSRQVYRNLIRNQCEMIRTSNLRYLVLVAGVNDTAGHYGKDFYSHHMMAMITVARSHGITPVLVEAPPYSIDRVQRKGLLSAIKASAFRYLFDAGSHNPISSYRKALSEKMRASSSERIVYVPTEALLESGTNMLIYANASHLNSEGNKRLAEGIGEAIITDYAAHSPRSSSDQ
jgi:hypothetical protein